MWHIAIQYSLNTIIQLVSCNTSKCQGRILLFVAKLLFTKFNQWERNKNIICQKDHHLAPTLSCKKEESYPVLSDNAMMDCNDICLSLKKFWEREIDDKRVK